MDELKRWMREIHEHVGENQHADADDEEDEEESIHFECDNDMKNQSLSTASVSPVNFGDAYAYADAPMTDAYPAPVSSFTPQNMQNMQFGDLSQCIDLTMPIDSSQSSFVDSHFAPMNEHMAFIDSFPHNFEDQSLGQDLFNTAFQYPM